MLLHILRCSKMTTFCPIRKAYEWHVSPTFKPNIEWRKADGKTRWYRTTLTVSSLEYIYTWLQRVMQ
ncbi:DEHA2B13266p [Debaryomyces hansenii CBS767]|uniref:DEHA2B13266p n=1 Tax=Debaryomyces hansenii (strain ATCC 36239 / CBS 767 / BCRC 21394 / JCM 1990 / NBRC 0083 / IGC 2968) TaxID=284592 RepID=Q6BW97_DEBHA|nr:DEHA2B13266p [Debaryomyces hansenii CBS767]CAG85531.1 DEHA2B13266p [Debaryomyces hansenii CBS767]|eukprot:XP_457522.1 DEHA2B13266p [Debaryomyces hansenii CBS767]